MGNYNIITKKFKEFLRLDSEQQTIPNQPNDNYGHTDLGEDGDVYLVGYKNKDVNNNPEIRITLANLADIVSGDGCGCNVKYEDDKLWYKVDDQWFELTIGGDVAHLGDIGDVVLDATLQPGHVLAWNGQYWVSSENIGTRVQSDWDELDENSPAYIKNKPVIPTTLNSLSDVNTSDVTNGQILIYDSGVWKPTALPSGGGGATTLAQLTDTTIPNSITNGYVLTWTGATWEPQEVVGTSGADGTDGQDGRSIEDIQVDGGGTPSTASGVTNIYNCIDQNGQVIGSFDVTNGVQGAPGTNGVDGITPLIQVDNDGYVTVSYDNGTTWLQQGRAYFQEGGTTTNNTYAINIKQNQAACTNVGDAYIDSNGHIQIYTGSSFVDGGNICGPQGLQGPQGPQGIQGPKGDDGDDGTNGVDGHDGLSIGSVTLVGTDNPNSGGSNTYSVKLTDNTQVGTFTVYNGLDGYTPVINSSAITGGTRVTVTVNGTTTNTFDVMNGTNGTNGTNGSPGADGTTFTLYRAQIAPTAFTAEQITSSTYGNTYYWLKPTSNSTIRWERFNPTTHVYTSVSTEAATASGQDYHFGDTSIIDFTTVDIVDVNPGDSKTDLTALNLEYGSFGSLYKSNGINEIRFYTIKDPSTLNALEFTIKVYHNIQ